MTTIIGYTYEADVHCINCTKKRFPPPSTSPDQHGVDLNAVDCEDNTIAPIFATTEILEDTHCGQCRDTIAEGPPGYEQAQPATYVPAETS